ncbi:MAG: hypothetical protein K1Y02_22950 [Candidatus Hydrogenedentes bacterium]|nr:hypothetical protein [Candidatus Hydrogenedentota bacterium]
MLEALRKAFTDYSVVLEPDRDEPGWWAGAPSVVRAPDGTFWMAARMRETISPPGYRGFELRILRSEDGIRFEPVHAIRREDAGVRGFERPALVIDPATGLFRLYACSPREEGGWRIILFDDASDPSRLDPASARPVLEPPATWGHGIEPGYKDPVVVFANGLWHMYVIGIDRVERTYHFTSADGLGWLTDSNNPVLESGGWHNFYTRPASVVPMGIGYLFVYEGSNAKWHDPNYNIGTGLAYTLDLSRITDLTPDAPALTTSTPGRYLTWRYSHWLRVGDVFHVYAECARANDSNEVRLFRVAASDLQR